MGTATLRYRKNTRGVRRDADYTRIITSLCARGADAGGLAFDIRDASWLVAAVDAATGWVTLQDDQSGPGVERPIVRFDGQLDHHLANPEGTTVLLEILESERGLPSRLRLASTDGVAAGQRLRIRRGGLCPSERGGYLLFLDHPEARAEHGLYEGVLEAPDVPPIDNLCPNPFLSDWSDDPTPIPLHWNPPGTVEREQDPSLTRFGGSSGYFRFLSGPATPWESEWIPITPTADRPYFSVQVSLMLRTGVVALEVDIDTVGDGSNIVTLPAAGSGKQAYTSVQNVWVDKFGIVGINCFDDADGTDPLAVPGGKRLRVRITKSTSPYVEGWLDAAQVTQSTSGFDSLYDRRASCELWHRINDALEAGWADPELRVQVHFLDYFRADPEGYAAERIDQGDTVQWHDEMLGIDLALFTSRVKRSLSRGMNTDADFVTLRRDLEQRLVGGGAPPRTPLQPPDPGDAQAPAGTSGGMLDSATLAYALDASGTPTYAVITWDHNQVIQADGAGRFTVTIDSNLYGAALVTGRDPKLEDADLDGFPRVGGYRFAVDTSGTTPVVHVVTVKLYDAGVLVQTLSVSDVGTYV